MKSLSLLAIAALVTLTGCASLNFAGNASYSVEPFTTSTGATVCCKVTIKDGKERTSLDLHVVKAGDNYDITLSEKSVLAFQGQKIAAEAQQQAVNTVAHAAIGLAVAPMLPSIIGTTAGAAAVGVAADKALTPATPKTTP